MRVIMILNQIQAGVGTKEAVNVPLTATTDALGPGVMMEALLKKYDEQLIATIYFGDATYTHDPATAQRKILGMLERLQADVVICGPSFDYQQYSKTSYELAQAITATGQRKAVCAMADTMLAQLDQPVDDVIPIVRMPKKGEAGLNTALEALCKVVAQVYKGNDKKKYAKLVY